VIFAGVNLTFFPQHFLGLNGIPRRYRDYPDEFYLWNRVSTLGRIISLIRLFFIFYIIWDTLVSHRSVVYNNLTRNASEWIFGITPAFHTLTSELAVPVIKEKEYNDFWHRLIIDYVSAVRVTKVSPFRGVL